MRFNNALEGGRQTAVVGSKSLLISAPITPKVITYRSQPSREYKKGEAESVKKGHKVAVSRRN